LFFIKFITLVFIGNNFYFNSVEIVTLTYNLRFAGFEEEWNSYFLEDVIKSFVNGQTPSRNVDSYWNGEIPWVSSGELNYNHITSTIEQITEEGKGKANLKLLPAGTFLMAITGLEAAGTRGSCAILDIEATTNQSCMALFPKEDKLTTKFLYYWYLKVGEHYGIKYTQGTKQQSYNKELLEKLPIVIPDNLKEQDKITDCLSLLHFKIELLEKKYKSYVDFKKYLMQQIFAQKLRFNFTDEWKKSKLKEICNVQDGTHTTPNYVDEGIPFYSVENLTSNVPPKFISKEEHEKLIKRCKPKFGDILITRIGTLAKSKVIDWEEEFSIYVSLALLSSIKINARFLNYYIQTDKYQKDFLKKSLLLAVPQKINLKDLNETIVEYPSSKEQEKIVNVFDSIDTKIAHINIELNNTKNFKRGLLQQMFNNVRLVVINLIINEYICPL